MNSLKIDIDHIEAIAEIGRVHIIVMSDMFYGFYRLLDHNKLVEALKLEPVEGKLIYKTTYYGDYICLRDEKTCYSMDILNRMGAELFYAYAAPEKPLITPIKRSDRWGLIIAPTVIEVGSNGLQADQEQDTQASK